MKSPMISLLQELLIELSSWCRTSADLDLKTIEARVENEGESFLTITLPSFAVDFQKSLDAGRVDHDLFAGFSFKGSLPRFLGGFFDLIFDRTSGLLREEPSIHAIFAIRQVTMAFGKVKLECSPERVKAAYDGYFTCEQDVKSADKRFIRQKDEFQRIGRMLFAGLYSDIDRMVYDGEILPKHGPGATADKKMGNQKFYQTEWPYRLDQAFPHAEFLFPNYRYYDGNSINILEPGLERPSRLIDVPKTLKTPRLIAIEPTAMQYAQQGLLEQFSEAIDRNHILSKLIGYSSQIPNQEAAKLGSLTGDLATLDLSEASDRVSNQHVLALLANHPHLREGVQACRSRKVDINGKVIRLAKFASMGSALCFPFEAMVFITIIFVGIEKELNRPLTRRDIREFAESGEVRTYGDDIIVPVRFVPSVVSALEDFGLKVNTRKSYWTGKFRESCGKDYYDGHDITVTRVRSLLPTQRKDVQEIISTVALRNQLYKAGLRSTSGFLDDLIGKLIPFPVVEETSPLLGKWNDEGYTAEKFHPTLHTPLVKGMLVKSDIPLNEVDDHFALLKSFLKRGELPFADRRHLERSGRPSRVGIITRWARPY